MIVRPPAIIACTHSELIYDEVQEMAQHALRRMTSPMVVIDVSRAERSSTAALAALVSLRGMLRREQRDLRVRGARASVAALLGILHLGPVLRCG
jgi:anti-anti-sigma regulatory factor